MTRRLRSAIGFLTVIPAGGGADEPAEGLGRALFPAVGLLLGAAAGGVFWGVSALTTPLLGAVAAVAALAALSGGLHLDALADAADGLLARADRGRRLEIMRDPRIGALGAAALALTVGGEVAALAGLDHLRALAALLGAGALSRFAMVAALAWLPYVRPAGLGSLAAVAGHRRLDLAIAGAVALVPLGLDWRHGLLGLAFAGLAGAGAGGLARARIGGATGDVYGAIGELSQLAVLVAFAVRLP